MWTLTAKPGAGGGELVAERGRGLGAPGMALSMIMLLYVASRIGYELGGFIGAAIPVVAFLAIEAFLFGATRPVPSADHP